MGNHSKPTFSARFDPVLLALLAVAAFLLFFHLDHRPFWQDEAETACLARNVVHFGLPLAFDDVNLISQEEGREFGPDHLWRWSPWLQIYLTAAAFFLGGFSTFAGRFPFALFGLLCVWLVYRLIKVNFGNRHWALMSAALLTFSVPFLLFSRQCRYYSLGAFFTLTALYAFRSDWQTRVAPAGLLVLSLGSLFYTNYLLCASFLAPALLAAALLYPRDLLTPRTVTLALGLIILIIPGALLFKFHDQASLLRYPDLGTMILQHLEKYWTDLLQFMVPLPICLYLLWRWRRVWQGAGGVPADPGERFVLFCALIVIGNIFFLLPAPQAAHRYLIHLYPLVAIVLGWTACCLWRYHKFSGALFGLMLLFTNWLQLVPLHWLGIRYFPIHNDVHMLTYPNLTIRNFLIELGSPYPDVNQNLINFFNTHARPGETILTTYGDLPLQFYTRHQILGGLQGRIPAPGEAPDWVVRRWHTRWNRDYFLQQSEDYILNQLNLARDYEMLVLPGEDEMFGNRADPYYHRFLPPEPRVRLVVYRKNLRVAHEHP
jgi:hypothetical protein